MLPRNYEVRARVLLLCIIDLLIIGLLELEAQLQELNSQHQGVKNVRSWIEQKDGGKS